MLLETKMKLLAPHSSAWCSCSSGFLSMGLDGRSNAAEQPALVLIISACNFLSSDLKTLLNRFS